MPSKSKLSASKKLKLLEASLPEDERAYDPKPKPKKRVKRKIPLPVEVWRRIVSHISHEEHASVSALLDTNKLMRDILMDPTSNAWARAFQDSDAERDKTVTLPMALKRTVHAQKKVANKEFDNQITPELAVTLPALLDCDECGSTTNSTVYWSFARRLCEGCVHELTVKESCIIYAMGYDPANMFYAHERLPMLNDFRGKDLHEYDENHYLMSDVGSFSGEGFEQYTGRGGRNYFSKKEEALECFQ